MEEATCKRCGRCCRKKSRDAKGRLVWLDYCDFLDTESKLCTVYRKRFAIYPKCITAAEAAENGCLPDDCPYVAGIENYTGPREPRAGEVFYLGVKGR